MPINATYEFFEAEKKFHNANTPQEKLKFLQEMLKTAPKHKSAGPLLKNIKERITKQKNIIQRERTSKKSSHSISFKREGAAQITLVGTTNSGKSTLLKKFTRANVKIDSYEFTTKKPEIGTFDYKGIKMQMIEIPAITENIEQTPLGPTLLSIISHSDLMILLFNNPKEKKLLDKELSDIQVKRLIYDESENFPDKIWKGLGLIKVYTKQPGKKPDYPPVALSKGSTVEDMAFHIHKDFTKGDKKFNNAIKFYAKVWGKSAKFSGQRVGYTHTLEDDDIVELHTK